MSSGAICPVASGEAEIVASAAQHGKIHEMIYALEEPLVE